MNNYIQLQDNLEKRYIPRNMHSMAKSNRNRKFELIIANKMIESAVKNLLAKKDLEPDKVKGEF